MEASPNRVNCRDRLLTKTQGAFLKDRSPLKLLCGGLGSGKTSTGADVFFSLVMLNPPGTHTMMVAPTMPMFRRFMQPAFERMVPRELILQHHRTEHWYLLEGHRRVWYGTASDPASLEGANLVAFWGDEIRYWPARSWQNLNARRRDRRARLLQGIATSTPAMGWMEEQFHRGLPGRAVHRISTSENEKHLAPGYIDDLRRTYSPRLCRSLIDGEFTVVEGQVFEAFDPARHLVDWQADPMWRTSLWVDFGFRRSSVLFVQELGSSSWHIDGRMMPAHSLVIFDELHAEDRPTERVLPLIQQRLQAHGLADRVDAIYCDPAGRARDVASGMPSVHLLQAAFGPVVRFTTDPRWTWIPNGIALVEGALNPQLGEPTLYVHRGLARAPRTAESNTERGVVKAFQGYRYPESGGDLPTKDGFYDHAMDALRYGVVGSLLARGQAGSIGVSLRHG